MVSQNLATLFEQDRKRFTLPVAARIAETLLVQLQQLHEERGIIHGKICLESILVDLNNPDGAHFASSSAIKLNSKAVKLFCSANFDVNNPRPVDDIEALGYLLVFLTSKTLPWIDQLELKRTVTVEQLCAHLPHEIHTFFYYLRRLPIDMDPSYIYLRGLLRSLKNQQVPATRKKPSTNHSRPSSNTLSFRLSGKRNHNIASRVHDNHSNFGVNSTKMKKKKRPVARPMSAQVYRTQPAAQQRQERTLSVHGLNHAAFSSPSHNKNAPKRGVVNSGYAKMNSFGEPTATRVSRPSSASGFKHKMSKQASFSSSPFGIGVARPQSASSVRNSTSIWSPKYADRRRQLSSPTKQPEIVDQNSMDALLKVSTMSLHRQVKPTQQEQEKSQQQHRAAVKAKLLRQQQMVALSRSQQVRPLGVVGSRQEPGPHRQMPTMQTPSMSQTTQVRPKSALKRSKDKKTTRLSASVRFKTHHQVKEYVTDEREHAEHFT